jgi:hypothetical protein
MATCNVPATCRALGVSSKDQHPSVFKGKRRKACCKSVTEGSPPENYRGVILAAPAKKQPYVRRKADTFLPPLSASRRKLCMTGLPRHVTSKGRLHLVSTAEADRIGAADAYAANAGFSEAESIPRELHDPWKSSSSLHHRCAHVATRLLHPDGYQ